MPTLALETYLLMLLGMSIVGGMAIGLHVWLSGKAKSTASPIISERSAEELQENGLQLVNQAAEILKIIRSQIAAGDRFSSSLADADKKLPMLTDPDKVRMIVKFLIAENAKMQQEANDLKQNLEHSQVQIEKLRTNLAEAEEVSVKDSLTSVSNRRGYDIAVAKAMAEASTLRTPLSLVICDLDHFKKINDMHGHPVGDEVLKIFAGILAENVRFGDTVARYGGEEFVVILTMTDAAGAAKVAERMRTQMAARRLALARNGEALGNVTASFGIAQFVLGDTADGLLARADAQLYEAKTSGRNRIAYSSKPPLAA